MSKSKKKTAAAPAKTTADYLTGVVERQMDMLKAYRVRQESIVRDLGAVQKLIGLGAFEAAVTAMGDLMAGDLKQAKDKHDNHRFALDIAIKALEDAQAERYCRATDALSQIELLAPEAFEKVAPAAAGKGS